MDGRGRAGLHSPCGSLLSLLHLALVKAQGLSDACHSLGSRQIWLRGITVGGNTHTRVHTHIQGLTLYLFPCLSQKHKATVCCVFSLKLREVKPLG